MKTLLKHYLEEFPKKTTDKDFIPDKIWPNLRGVSLAKTKELPGTKAAWKKFWKDAVKFPLIAVDSETSGTKPFHEDFIAGVSAAYYDEKRKAIIAGYWDFGHQGHKKHTWCERPHTKDKKMVKAKRACKDCARKPCPGETEPKGQRLPGSELKAMIPAFENCIILGQNVKFDFKFFAAADVPVPYRALDTLLIAHLWDENRRKRGGSYALSSLAEEMGEKKLGGVVDEWMAKHFQSIKVVGHCTVPYKVERPYAIADAVITLKRCQWERMQWLEEKDPRLMGVFQIENGCLPAFARMEVAGLKMDPKYITLGVNSLTKEVNGYRRAIFKLAKKEFDLDSEDQLWEIMDKRGLKPLKFTASGKPMVSDVQLMQYEDKGDKLAAVMRNYRKKNKVLSTYFTPFDNDHMDKDHIIHADFFIHGTSTGRASCRVPNLQNMSRFEVYGTRTKTGSIADAIRKGLVGEDLSTVETIEVRRCFVPRSKDHSLFFFDYSQMEIRIFADYTNEIYMLDTLKKGIDIHEATARKVFPEFPEKKDNELMFKYFRQLAKQINFGIIYGMGRGKLAVQLNVPVDETTRALELLQLAWKLGRKDLVNTTLTPKEVETLLEDHRTNTLARKWEGLRRIQSTVRNKVDIEKLEELAKSDEHQRYRYSAEKFMANYHKNFPKIKEFTRQIQGAISKRGYIFNRYGRRYHLETRFAYQGVNRLIQGTSADMVKLAQCRVDHLCEGTRSKRILRSPQINQVHDEIQVDLHKSDLKLVPLIKEAMECYPNIGVKMEVDVDYSLLSWSDKRPWKGEAEWVRAYKELHGKKKQNKSGGKKS